MELHSHSHSSTYAQFETAVEQDFVRRRNERRSSFNWIHLENSLEEYEEEKEREDEEEEESFLNDVSVMLLPSRFTSAVDELKSLA